MTTSSTTPTAAARAQLGERALFPTLDARVYLAHAAISPLPEPARAAVDDVLAEYARRGFFAWQRGQAEQSGLKAELAALLGASVDDLALTRGTSSSVTAVAQSFPFEAGDGLVLLRGEFPTNVTPWLMAARGSGLLVHWLDADAFRPGGEGLSQLEHLLRERAGHIRLVAMSAVQFQTGLRMPLDDVAALCRRHGAALSVDAIQAAGVVPLDLAALDADFVAGGAHKWLMGLEGVGWLWAAPRWRGRLRPALASWLSHEDPVSFLGEAGQLRYDRPIR
ncbi:MAG: aminotransferase class V-fold PLP-dependent enzyme, partial [Myxococcales bacterium]|nr:aminotransferase class V-fold PLP-dependent enzyme [Myxococcales bacterium]